jgi:hypothetical protein
MAKNAERTGASSDARVCKSVEGAAASFARKCAGVAISAAERHGITLDYTEESLAGVDKMLLMTHDGVRRIGLARLSRRDNEALDLVAEIFGCYVGEVVLRVVGGGWTADVGPDGNARLLIQVGDAVSCPMEAVRQRLTEFRRRRLRGYCQLVRTLVGRRRQHR